MKHTLIALAPIGLTSCATYQPGTNLYASPNRSTPYIPYSPDEYPFVGGYFAEKVNDNGLYLVGFVGNNRTPLSLVRDSAKYRAAEIAVRNGYKYVYIFRENCNSTSDGTNTVIYAVAMHNEFFNSEFGDAAQLMLVLANAYTFN